MLSFWCRKCWSCCSYSVYFRTRKVPGTGSWWHKFPCLNHNTWRKTFWYEVQDLCYTTKYYVGIRNAGEKLCLSDFFFLLNWLNFLLSYGTFILTYLNLQQSVSSHNFKQLHIHEHFLLECWSETRILEYVSRTSHVHVVTPKSSCYVTRSVHENWLQLFFFGAVIIARCTASVMSPGNTCMPARMSDH